MILISPKGDKLRYVLQMDFKRPTNNEAEYEALLHGMRMAKNCGATHLMIYGDSNRVVQQTMKECDAVADNMIAYRDMYNILEGNFEGCELRHIGRESNDEADMLANIGSRKEKVPEGVFLECIKQRSIRTKQTQELAPTVKAKRDSTAENKDALEAEPIEVLLIEPIWTNPFLAYILHKKLPSDSTEAKRIIRRSKAFTVINGELYKRSISGVLQRCIDPEDGKAILLDIHVGTYEIGRAHV